MRKIFFVLMLIHVPAFADLDASSQQGLDQTKALLKNPEERQKAIKGDKKAEDVDNKVSALAGSKERKQDIYELSAEIMDRLTKEANGDPEKMKAMLKEAQENPEAFYNRMFSAEQKKKVSDISKGIENDKPKVAAPK